MLTLQIPARRVVLVCGGRVFQDREFLFSCLDGCHKLARFTFLVHGAADGADTLAEEWAKARCVPFAAEPAEWTRYGKKAGSIRNQLMLDKWRPDVCVAFPGGSGTADMCMKAMLANVSLHRMVEAHKVQPPAKAILY